MTKQEECPMCEDRKECVVYAIDGDFHYQIACPHCVGYVDFDNMTGGHKVKIQKEIKTNNQKEMN